MRGLKVALMMSLLIGATMAIGACGHEETTKPSGDATALVLCDLQRSFLQSNGEMPVARDEVVPLIEAVNAIIDAARHHVIPVIYVRDEYSPFQFISNLLRHGAAL